MPFHLCKSSFISLQVSYQHLSFPLASFLFSCFNLLALARILRAVKIRLLTEYVFVLFLNLTEMFLIFSLLRITWQGEGESEMYRENNTETYITICKIYSQWEFVYDSGNSNRGSETTQKGGMGREIHVYLWLIHVDIWTKNQYNSVKQLSFH